MRKALIVTGLALSCMVASCSPPSAIDDKASALNSSAAPSSSSLSVIRAKVAAVASPTASAVTVAWADSQLSVSIENSSLNDLTHSARNSEAVTIADAIAAAALNEPELKGLLGIHVEYVAREAGANRPRIVDSIDFRRDSSGRMTLHTT